jgi:DNA-binding transcriptional MerR regulator
MIDRAGARTQGEAAEQGGKITIGSLSRATGIPVETLRTWEHRYGFPDPERKESGHRLYSLSTVARLRRVAAALQRGYRAAQVVAASDQVLDELLATPIAAAAARRAAPGAAAAVAARQSDLDAEDRAALVQALAAVSAFDAPALTRQLERAWIERGPIEFLTRRVAPLLAAVGDGWARHELEIRHEHFLSERVGDLLRALRLRFDDQARESAVVLATLPGETHGLGLQMSALALAVGGCRIVYLGTEVPLAEAVGMARETQALALGLSVSAATAGPATSAVLARVRRLLPRRTALLVGGAGAPPAPPPGALVFADLVALAAWARAAAAGSPARPESA